MNIDRNDAAMVFIDTLNEALRFIDTGHFTLEEDGDKIAELMRNFLRRNVRR